MEPQGLEMTNTASDLNALERLENRIVEIVEQLRSARALQQEAEQESEKLRGQLEEKELEISQMRALTSGSDAQQSEVRRRIESLLERVEGLG